MQNGSNDAAADRAQTVFESGARPETSFSRLPLQAARVTRDTLEFLARDPRIAHISIDHPFQGTLATTAKTIGADQVWAGDSATPGVSGKGVTIAVIDSGVGDNISSARDLWTQVRLNLNFVSGTTGVNDADGHGTHVA
jgi:subtilisin family serine protease